MRLFELEKFFKGLPKRAGNEAKIQWIDWENNGESLPKRSKEVITLPVDNAAEFFPLKGGNQFIFKTPNTNKYNSQYYFGGTDERAFLVEMDRGFMSRFDGDEEKFYSDIKPPKTKLLETILGACSVRQGDWFAVPFLGMSFKEVKACLQILNLWDGKETINAPDNATSLSGTRHVLKGNIIFMKRVITNTDGHNWWGVVGEGVLTAPDHSDKFLKGPHIFEQTSHLALPTKAD